MPRTFFPKKNDSILYLKYKIIYIYSVKPIPGLSSQHQETREARTSSQKKKGNTHGPNSENAVTSKKQKMLISDTPRNKSAKITKSADTQQSTDEC